VPGTYHSTESAKTGWDLTDLTCTTDGSGSGSIATFNLHAGETITCTFTNTQRGTIIVKKVTSPAGGTGFTYTGDAAGTIDDGGNITVNNLVPGTYHSTESAKTGWDLTDLTCTTDGSGSGSTATFTLHAGETITCTFTNTPRGSLVIKKVTLGADGTFNYTGGGTGVPASFSITTNSNAGSYPPITNLLPGSGYSVSEQTPNNGQKGFAMVGTGSCDHGTPGAITIVAGQTTTCTFTNATAFTKVVKTLNGSSNLGANSFTFQLRIGASISAAGTTLETLTASSVNGGILNFVTHLIPGTTYEMCEQMQPGWLTTLGPPLYSVFNPSGDNSVVCTNFTPAAGQTSTTTFTINNQPPPGGMALTIGFWKNWSSCTRGGQKPTLDKTLFNATPPGIFVGLVDLLGGSTPNVSPYCAEAVDILNKATITGVKKSSNPFYNLAAQLLAAELNGVAGAGQNACVLSDIQSAQNLLVAVKFDDSIVPTGTSLQINDANYFQTQLNKYNNNLPFTCTITYP
jgi:prealbumin domain-containing protein